MPVERAFEPKEIYLSLSEVAVSAGSTVDLGETLGKGADGMPVRSGISGKISEITKISDCEYVVKTENDFERRISGEVLPFGKENNIKVTDLTPEMLVNVIERASVRTRGKQISLSDRTISQRVLDSFGKAKQIVVNCVGTEPYDTSVGRIILENRSDIINGMKIVMSAMKIGEGVILLDSENNEHAKALSELLSEKDNIKVVLADPAYPADNEHNVIYTLTSIEISRARNAERVGCIVFDAREVCAIGRAFVYGEPETCECVTLSGDALSRPMNVSIPYGTKISEITEFCGMSKDEGVRIFAGGVLRGREVTKDDLFESGMSPIVVLNGKSVPTFNGTRCIRCGSCMRVCPMLLMPMYLSLAGVSGIKAVGKLFDISSCVECGVCQYVCPSAIPILENIRKMKNAVKEVKTDAADEESKENSENKENKENNENNENKEEKKTKTLKSAEVISSDEKQLYESSAVCGKQG